MFNLDRALAERMIELEVQVSALSEENRQLRDREMRSIRTESERAKAEKALRTERSIEAVRQLLRQPYAEAGLPTVHKLLSSLAYQADTSRVGTTVTVNSMDLRLSREELDAAKEEALANAAAIRDSLATVVRASQLDRQEWLDNCSDDLRNLWHLEAK